MFEIQWYIILFAFILDFILGDPIKLPHPIIYMGNAISFFEIRFRQFIKEPFFSGLLFAGFLIVITGLIGWIIIKLSIIIHPVFGSIVQMILLFYCFSSKSLEKAAQCVFMALKENDIEKARENVSMIVGRQTEELDEKGITRATVETVAENFVDGFLSPLFFAMIGGVPLALVYKMINTLDSMVGYKNDTYILFGRASARIDDIANFIPARLSVFIISLSAFIISLSKGILAFKTGLTQGDYHKSPNAGYPEASFAGALEIKLGGPNVYHGTLVDKPFIGKGFQDPGRLKIKQACELMMLSSFIATLISCFILFII
ncbi:MAG: cobalamin biosynthesis protein CobD [Desulfobacteraceae bacterium]|nr:cobalamin biosynthesis protein CobD [Desulfobacteraceae bacterium]